MNPGVFDGSVLSWMLPEVLDGADTLLDLQKSENF